MTSNELDGPAEGWPAPGFVIGQAVGILMERNAVRTEVALQTLRSEATRCGVTLTDMARDMVRSIRDNGPTVSARDMQARGTASREWPGGELSYRERQVLTLIASGATNNDIAEELYLGINTIKTYVRTAYRKIGVTRRTQAVLWGIENGLNEG